VLSPDSCLLFAGLLAIARPEAAWSTRSVTKSDVCLIGSLLALGGCCLTTVSGEPGEQTTGGMTSGGVPGGGSTSSGGGSTTGANRCLGIYCAPSFACDPADGVCKCDGQNCSGNCDAATGACLVACAASDGGTYPVIGDSPYAIQMPTAYLDRTYNESLQLPCGSPPFRWTLLSGNFENIGLGFYPAQGQVEGVLTMASGADPFEFEIEAQDALGNTGVQNYLLQVVGGPGP
jgi:hypothetical protein